MFQCHDFKSFPLSGNIIKTVQEHGQLISRMQGGENVYGLGERAPNVMLWIVQGLLSCLILCVSVIWLNWECKFYTD